MQQPVPGRHPIDTLALEEARRFAQRFWPDNENVAKHERLRRAITNAIEGGYWKAGARLPTEQALAATTPCSLGTVQRALRALSEEGLILRRQGSGTMVARLDGRLDEPWHIRVPDSGREDASFLPVFTQVIRRRMLKTTGVWSAPLHQVDEPVLRIDRVFSLDRRIDIYAVFYALADRFPELRDLPTDALNGKNFKMLIAQRYLVPVHRLKQQVQLVLPPPQACRHSDCREGEPCIRLSVTAYSLSREAIYYQDFFVPQTPEPLDLGIAVHE